MSVIHIHEIEVMVDGVDDWLTGVVMSAAKSSRRSASTFARKRAARARARGVVRSCWTGRDVDAELGIDLDARTGLGVARADADIRLDIVNAAEGEKGAKAMSGDIRRQAKSSTSDDDGGGGDGDEDVVKGVKGVVNGILSNLFAVVVPSSECIWECLVVLCFLCGRCALAGGCPLCERTSVAGVRLAPGEEKRPRIQILPFGLSS